MCDSKAYLLGTALCCSISSALCLLPTFVKEPLLHGVCAQMEIPPWDFRRQPVLPNGAVTLGNLVGKVKFRLPLVSGGCEYGLPSKNIHTAWQ